MICRHRLKLRGRQQRERLFHFTGFCPRRAAEEAAKLAIELLRAFIADAQCGGGGAEIVADHQ